jgi:CRP-like cAMP-binding protein
MPPISFSTWKGELIVPSVEENVHFLSKVPLFQSLKRGQLERLARVVTAREYEAGQDIVTQGKGGAGLFIIVSGKAEAIRVRSDGSSATVNIFVRTDFFGELALLHEGPRTASVVATEPTQCLVLSRWDFLSILRQDAEMAVMILEEIAFRFRMALEIL